MMLQTRTLANPTFSLDFPSLNSVVLGIHGMEGSTLSHDETRCQKRRHSIRIAARLRIALAQEDGWILAVG